MTFPWGARGGSNICNWWRFHQQILWQILCLHVCTNKAMEVWEKTTVQNKNIQIIHYANIISKMRIVCCNMLANREKKIPKKSCKGPCKVLQWAMFRLRPWCHMLSLWAWKCPGKTLLRAALQVLPPSHCCGASLGATRGTVSPQGENGTYKCSLQRFYRRL